MANHSVKELDSGQLDYMWNFLRMGNGKPNVRALKELCDQLRTLMIQKTAGQTRKNENDLPFSDIGTIVNCIAIETMQIYLSGGFDVLDKHYNENGGNNNE